ncbi:MAG: CpXC domain-containing protein [Bacteroidales bacterium]|nr:CpXC domain-containing protein [Bacteroidales bacterium]
MSVVKQALARCSRCRHEHEITIYKSINTAEDADMETRVLNGSLFMWTCPDCGCKNLVSYECLYHDPARKRMLWLLPRDKADTAEMDAIARHARSLGGYTLRICPDLGSLIEKILILNAGLNDVAIEICKYVIRGEWAQQAQGHADAPLHFHHLEQDQLVFSYPSNGQMASLTLGKNVYEDALGILSRNPSLQSGEGFRRVDADWLATVIA